MSVPVPNPPGCRPLHPGADPSADAVPFPDTEPLDANPLDVDLPSHVTCDACWVATP